MVKVAFGPMLTGADSYENSINHEPLEMPVPKPVATLEAGGGVNEKSWSKVPIAQCWWAQIAMKMVVIMLMADRVSQALRPNP